MYAGDFKATIKALTSAYGLGKHDVSAMVHSLFGSFGVEAEGGFLMRIAYWMDYALELLGCSLRSSAKWIGDVLHDAMESGWFTTIAHVMTGLTGVLAFAWDWCAAVSLIESAKFLYSKVQVATAMKLVHPLQLPLPRLPVLIVAEAAAYRGEGFSAACGAACGMLVFGAISMASKKMRPIFASGSLSEPFMSA